MPPSTTRSTFNATSSPAARSGRSEPRRPLHGRQPRLWPKRARHPDLCDFASVPVTTPCRGQITPQRDGSGPTAALRTISCNLKTYRTALLAIKPTSAHRSHDTAVAGLLKKGLHRVPRSSPCSVVAIGPAMDWDRAHHCRVFQQARAYELI